jgi:hypothetical protein
MRGQTLITPPTLCRQPVLKGSFNFFPYMLITFYTLRSLMRGMLFSFNVLVTFIWPINSDLLPRCRNFIDMFSIIWWRVGASHWWKRSRFRSRVLWDARHREHTWMPHGPQVHYNKIKRTRWLTCEFYRLRRLLHPPGSGYGSETGGLMEALRKLTPERSGLWYFLFVFTDLVI